MRLRNTFLIVLFSAFLFCGIVNSQVLFSDNFSYTTGNLVTQGGWTAGSGAGTTPMQVIATSLTYPGYSFGTGVGGAVQIGTSGEDDFHLLGTSLSSGAVYASLLVNCSAASAAGDYFVHFADGGTFNLFCRTAIRSSATNTFDFGLEKYSAGGSYVYTNQPLNFNQTYLIVIKYKFNPTTTTDDEVDLFVSPTIGGTEPTPTISTSAGTDITGLATPSSISSINFRQGSASNAPTVQVDGLIVGTQWSDVLPVELTSFSASVVNNNVNLRWSTASEINNKGFEVQRKLSGSKDNYTTIANINGNGTSTEIHNYSYTDKLSVVGKYSYRLKQVDYSGAFSYSKTVEVEFNAPVQFGLNQNFPNPFNPSTTINFSIAKAGNVSLKVYNLLGQEVRTLLTGFKEAGSYTVNFNAEGLNSGLYIYKLETDNFSQVKKMTLLK
ncbi:MAG: T9SS type A sorting domain-containing protein [Ignavibacteriaceae bacterium]|nr:T9SS type A sorting domain-containing protein [Ignavibacteriaceae bacterium]